MNGTSDSLYRMREKRVVDAVELRVPDRVPVTASFAFFPARYCGCTMKEMMYDPDKLWEVHLKTTRDFEPDIAQNPFPGNSLGSSSRCPRLQTDAMPGGQLGPDVPYQFVEGEYMKADECDHFFSEPMDFMVRKYWPRISGSLKGLEMLPPFSNSIRYMGLGIFNAFTAPEIRSAMETLLNVAKVADQIGSYSCRFAATLKEEGFQLLGVA